MKYEANFRSVKKHIVPEWFHDAKLGIFIHWGLYSVPAFAVTGLNLVESMKLGLEEHYKCNPYAEWYLNSLRIQNSPTQKYHNEHYGKDFAYDDFVPIFNKEIKKWDPKKWANLFKKAGARYVVLVTKHHDGFLMWDSKYPNPNIENYLASRDIVGELSKEVRKKGMIMGFYYSGTLDWSFNLNPIKDGKSFVENGVRTPEYVEYANNHWYELIDKYKTSILWNDIGYVPTNAYEIFAYFYNKFPEGVINDRWKQLWKKGDTFPKVHHYDFLTPEYEVFEKIVKKKWEANRGIGNSYGYNQMENEGDYLTSDELIRMFVDIVSKNGNLLLNVGPMADGTIPITQQQILLDLGNWLEVNGDSIYGTRPWIKAEGKTFDGIDIRFTQKENSLYVHLFEKPKGNNIIIPSFIASESSKIELLANKIALEWTQSGENIRIYLPKKVSQSAVYVIKITPKPN